MCSLSWGVQFRFLLLDAVKTNDVLLMLLSTCSAPLKITKQNLTVSIHWTELSINWPLVLILLSVDRRMSELASKCKYFPSRASKTTSYMAHWKLFVVVNSAILVSLNPPSGFCLWRERTVSGHKPTHESGRESLADSGKKPEKYLGER